MFFFVNQTYHFFALGGSSHHVIGNVRSAEANSSLSYASSLLSTLDIAVSGAPELYSSRGARLAASLQSGIASDGTIYPWTRMLEQLSSQFGEAQALYAVMHEPEYF